MTKRVLEHKLFSQRKNDVGEVIEVRYHISVSDGNNFTEGALSIMLLSAYPQWYQQFIKPPNNRMSSTNDIEDFGVIVCHPLLVPDTEYGGSLYAFADKLFNPSVPAERWYQLLEIF